MRPTGRRKSKKDSSDEEWELPTKKTRESFKWPQEDCEDDNASESSAEWTDIITLRSIPFREVNGLRIQKPGEGRPIDYFLLLADDPFLASIAECVNCCASKLMASSKSPSSRISRWKPLTVDDLKVFVGLLLHTGTFRAHRLMDYWRRGKLFGLPCFPGFMSRDRFLMILQSLCFTKGANLSDPLHKVRGLVDYFNRKMDTVYSPRKDLAVNDRLVLWKGRVLPQRQFEGKSLENKIRLYSLSECGGVTLRMMVCVGDPSDDHMEDVVMVLAQGRLSKGHSLYLDPDYCGVSLAAKLLDVNTYCTGLLRPDYRDLPEEVRNHGGETVVRQTGGVVVGGWAGQTYLSTEFDNEMISLVNNKGKDRSKPSPVYNFLHRRRWMGLDRTEQMMNYYSADGNTFEWHKKVFVHLLQVIVMNAYILHSEFASETKMPFYDFRLSVIDALLPSPEFVALEPCTILEQEY